MNWWQWLLVIVVSGVLLFAILIAIVDIWTDKIRLAELLAFTNKQLGQLEEQCEALRKENQASKRNAVNFLVAICATLLAGKELPEAVAEKHKEYLRCQQALLGAEHSPSYGERQREGHSAFLAYCLAIAEAAQALPELESNMKAQIDALVEGLRAKIQAHEAGMEEYDVGVEA
ncbi:hypothetical protein JNK13_01775 [bacterium]|nr:hypothetical protein [bacterium]